MITTQNYSSEEGNKGFIVYFPIPPNTRVNKEYILYFDAPITLPKNYSTVISFEPFSGSYSVQVSEGFVPKVFVKIQTTKKIKTKTLLRLIIKDTKNNTLHTDYIMVVCSPESPVIINGILIDPSISGGVSPNGGGLFQIIDTTESSSSIGVGSSIIGPGIPDDEIFFVKSIISNNLIELNKVINFSINLPYSGGFSFTNNNCVNSNNTVYSGASSDYTVLDFNNNWTYKIRNQNIAQFIPEEPEENQDLVVLLPLKNTLFLGQSDFAQPIPSVCVIKIEE